MPPDILPIKDFPAHLARLTPADWKPLLDLIPEIEQATVFGEEKGMEEVRPGVWTFPYWESSPEVSHFMIEAYRLGIVIDFDWPGWDEGRKLASGNLEKIDTLELITLCKLITAIIRNDRFYDGALVSSFESGLMQRVLRAIRATIMAY